MARQSLQGPNLHSLAMRGYEHYSYLLFIKPLRSLYLPLTDDFGIGESLQRARRVRPCRLKSASMPPTPLQALTDPKISGPGLRSHD